MKQLGIMSILAVGGALVAFACDDDGGASDGSGGKSGMGGSSAGTAGEGGQNNGGTAAAGRGGTTGGGGRGGAGGTGGNAVECSSASHMSDIELEACDAGNARCDVGEECCCGECAPSFTCYCDDGRWWCSYTDFCLSRESCGGAGGQGGQGGLAGHAGQAS
jgi:hypothetical protein